MITALAIFLGSEFSIRRKLAILIGFLGALFIVQPATTDFDMMTSLVFISAVGMTLRDIGTRISSKNFSTLLLSFYSCLLFSISGCVLLLITGGTACLI